MNYIVMDLEWNQPLSGSRKVTSPIKLNGEIIQIGAIRLSSLDTLEVTGTFNEIIKPVHYTKMRRNVIDVTGLTDRDIEKGRPFVEVCDEFLDWCGDEYVFITWSENDIYMLEDNMILHDLDEKKLPACFDMQVMFDDQITHEERNFALGYALWKLGLLENMQESHDALNDVRNTIEVMKHLDLNDGFELCEVGVWEDPEE